jgi:hypothetical protein
MHSIHGTFQQKAQKSGFAPTATAPLVLRRVQPNADKTQEHTLKLPASRYAGPELSDARRLLAAAKTGQLWAWGGNVLGLASCRLNRFTLPEPVALVSPCQPAANSGGNGDANSDVAAAPAAPAIHPVSYGGADRRRHSMQSSGGANVREACAASDFAVLLTWDGCVADSRVLPGGARAQQAQQRQRPLELPPLWRPPGAAAAVLKVAAGGCWQGEGALEAQVGMDGEGNAPLSLPGSLPDY